MKKCLQMISALLVIVLITGCHLPLPSETTTTTRQETKPTATRASVREIAVAEELVGHIMGGFHYTAPDLHAADDSEEQYLTLRRQTMDVWHDAMQVLASDAISLSEALTAFEQLLAEALPQIRDDGHGTIRAIMEGLLANRAFLNAGADQIAALSAIRPTDDLLTAAVHRLLFETICGLVARQQSYIPWLLGSTEVIITLLEIDSDEAAEALALAGCELFADEISNPLRAMLTQYFEVAALYINIQSADYYMGEYYLTKAGMTLNQPDFQAREDYDEIRSLYEDIMSQDRKPLILRELPSEQSNANTGADPANGYVLLSATTGDDYDEYLTQYMAVLLLGAAVTGTSIYGEFDTGDEAILNMLLDTKLNNSIREGYINYVNSGRGQTYRSELAAAAQISEQTNEENQAVVVQLEAEAQALQRAADPALDREALIGMISTAQMTLSTAGLFLSAESQYNLLVTILNSLMRNDQQLDPLQVSRINDVLNNDLTEILGDQVEAFMAAVLQTNAEQLLDIFVTWQESLSAPADFNLTREDIIHLVNLLGIYVEPDVLPLVERDYWLGTVGYQRSQYVFTNGTVSDLPIANDFSGVFRFILIREQQQDFVELEQLMTYAIDFLTATEVFVDHDEIRMTWTGEKDDVDHLITFEGMVDQEQSSMAGECTYTMIFSDAFRSRLDTPNNFAGTARTIQFGTWSVDRFIERSYPTPPDQTENKG